MNRRRGLTTEYAAVTGAFWMAEALVLSFAAVFLRDQGYSNTELGLICALGNVGGALIGPFLGSLLDSREKLSPLRLIELCLGVQAVSLAFLFLFPGRNLAATVNYSVYIAFCLPINSLSLKMYTDADRSGIPLRYGVSRSSGSFFYLVASVLVGRILLTAPTKILLYLGIPALLIQFLVNLIMDRRLKKLKAGLPAAAKPEEILKQEASSLPEFARNNGNFCVLLFATVLMFFSHSLNATYTINLMDKIGGDVAIMGYVHGLIALVEIPPLLLYPKLRRRLSATGLLKFASLSFFLKALGYALAPNVPLYFLACLLQAPSYGIYASAIVEYVNHEVLYKDIAKGQSLAFSMTILASVLASLVGGRLLDKTDVTTTFLIAAAVAGCGTLIALFALRRSERA